MADTQPSAWIVRKRERRGICMGESKGTRGYLSGEVDAAQEKLRAYLAREPDRRRLGAGDVVRRMATEIATMKERGFSANEIVTAMAECGVKISVNALASQWSVLQKEKSQQNSRPTAPRAGDGERRRKVAGASVAAAKLSVGDVTAPSSTINEPA